MISPQTFAEGMALIAERWNRAWGAQLQATYYEQLTAELDDADFIAGVKLCIRDGGLIPPSIQQIISAGKPPYDEELEAAAVFRAILDGPIYLPSRGSFWSASHVEKHHGTAAARAFIAAGGERRFNHMADKDIPYALKEFKAAYLSALEEEWRVGQLATVGGRTDPRLPTEAEAAEMAMDRRNLRRIEAANELRPRYGLPLLPLPRENGNGHGQPKRLGDIAIGLPEFPKGDA